MPERYQDEIEEILRRAGEIAPADPSRPREDDRTSRAIGAESHESPASYATKRRWPRLTAGKLLLSGLLVLVMGAVFWTPAVWIGLALIVVAYLMFFVKPRAISYEKRWRGQVIDEQPSAWDRLKRWLRD